MGKGNAREKQVIAPSDVGTLSMGEAEVESDDIPHLYERVDALIESRGFKRDEEGNWPEGLIFERKQKHRGDIVTVRLSFPNGDSLGAQGATTEAAVTLLEQRLAEWPQ
jgi:hypothetical protein